MKYLFLLLITLPTMQTPIIFSFNQNSTIEQWRIADDIVMGGKSSSRITIGPDGYGIFKGQISLENNGGFSSVQCRFPKKLVNDFTKIRIKLKGDGKNYQFRIKANANDAYSYISTIKTSGDWQEIDIQLSDMYPSFRGRRLDEPNFSNNYIEAIAFLIGNKTAENFILHLDTIELK